MDEKKMTTIVDTVFGKTPHYLHYEVKTLPNDFKKAVTDVIEITGSEERFLQLYPCHKRETFIIRVQNPATTSVNIDIGGGHAVLCKAHSAHPMRTGYKMVDFYNKEIWCNPECAAKVDAAGFTIKKYL